MTQAPKYQESFQDAAGRMALPWRRWVEAVDRAIAAGASAASAADIAAIATALGSPDGTVANIPDQDSLAGVIYGRNGVMVEGKLGRTPVYVELQPLEDSGVGAALYKLTRDDYGRVEGTEEAAATDLPYDNTTSGLTATDVQAAIDEVAVGSGVAWSITRKTADEARTSTTTVADDSQLAISLAAGTRYRVRFNIAINQASGGVGFKFKVKYTGTTTLVAGHRWLQLATSSGTTTGYETALFDNFFSTASAGVSFFEFDYVIQTGTSGTLSFQWAQNTSSANATTMQAGSFIESLVF